MGRGERKFTFEHSRAQAEEVLQAYERGMTPKELTELFQLNVRRVWQKMEQAKKWRARAQEVPQ